MHKTIEKGVIYIMSKKVMIVDDSRVVQIQLQQVLADSEYEIITCCQSGEEAISQYNIVKPDVVTMDILMPGIDGLETARQILQAHPDAKILMVSSLAYDDTIEEAKQIGTKGFIYKPFNREQILKSMDDIFCE